MPNSPHCLSVAELVPIQMMVKITEVVAREKKERKTSHVKKTKNHGELAMAEWGKKNNLLTA